MESPGTIIISALIGGLVAWIGSIINNSLEKRSRIDESLRKARLAVYQPLWQQTSLLPMWPKNDKVTYERLLGFSVSLTEWYYNEGGIYLSREAMEVYIKLQDAIQDAKPKEKGAERLSDIDYDLIRKKCSCLRTELTSDLLSRRRVFLFGGSLPTIFDTASEGRRCKGKEPAVKK